MAVTGTKALEVWCRQVTAGYSNVNILNMTTSWRSGLGFCAIIHHFCPHLIEFDSLDPDDVFGNNSLAFSTAEQHRDNGWQHAYALTATPESLQRGIKLIKENADAQSDDLPPLMS